MAKLARNHLTEEKTVEVVGFKQVTESLGVLSFREDHEQFDDIYNVSSKETMDTLLLDRAGKRVFATIKPDVAGDKDNHPEIASAKVEEVEGATDATADTAGGAAGGDEAGGAGA